MAVLVQFGCGMNPAPGWRNFDASPTLFYERLPILGRLYTKNGTRFPKCVEYGNIVRGLPIAPASCDAVYCSHVLEHLALDDFRAAIRNVYEILKPAAPFRLVVPDLRRLAAEYLSDPSDDAAVNFLDKSSLGQRTRPKGLQRIVDAFGNSAHLWMWDFNGIRKELAAAGFVDIRRAAFGDSSLEAFHAAEDEGRWKDCLGVECRKPTYSVGS